MLQNAKVLLPLVALAGTALGELPEKVSMYEDIYTGGVFATRDATTPADTGTTSDAALEVRGSAALDHKAAELSNSLMFSLDHWHGVKHPDLYTTASMDGRHSRTLRTARYDVNASSQIVRWREGLASPVATTQSDDNGLSTQIKYNVDTLVAFSLDQINEGGVNAGLAARAGQGSGTDARSETFLNHRHSTTSESHLHLGFSKSMTDNTASNQFIYWTYDNQITSIDNASISVGFGRARQGDSNTEKFLSASAKYSHPGRTWQSEFQVSRGLVARPVTHIQAVATEIGVDFRNEFHPNHAVRAQLDGNKEEVVLQENIPAAWIREASLSYEYLFGQKIKGINPTREYTLSILAHIVMLSDVGQVTTKTYVAGLAHRL